tara:strand:- start:461 stop:640 length:180 start_codon:yes stop_codon:yes gene_type:complete
MTDETIYRSISEELANNSEESYEPLTGRLSFNVLEGYIRDGIYVGDDMYIEGADYEDLF